MADDLSDRVIGCLLGGAYGDALGAPVENSTASEIKKRFGTWGITRPPRSGSFLGGITDDTQLTLFTVEGLLRAMAAQKQEIDIEVPSVVHGAYQRWLTTQRYRNMLLRNEDSISFLTRLEALNASRNPVPTCLVGLQDSDFWGQQASTSKNDVGAVMRIAPVGLLGAITGETYERTFILAYLIAGLTHGNETAKTSAGYFAVLCQMLTSSNERILKIFTTSIEWIRNMHMSIMNDDGEIPNDACTRTLQAITRAFAIINHHREEKPAVDRLPPELGTGDKAEEAIAIALYCFMTVTNPGDALRLSVNHDGKSDTAGALTGQLIGAHYGYTNLNRRIGLDFVELSTTIKEIATDLALCPKWPEGLVKLHKANESLAFLDKYPPH